MADPYYVTDLKSGTVWANNHTGVTVTYEFWQTMPTYYSSFDTERNNFQPFTTAMKDAVHDILGQISTFANITFKEVTTQSQAQIGYGQARLDTGVEAWAYYPDSSDPYAGDVWTNNRYADSQDMTKGNYGFLTLLHETGHALGLKHSFETPNALPTAEDNSRYTVMSYTDPVNPESYMIYDIAALQSLYGANMTYATGNDDYVLKAGHVYTIWDAGGTDTFDGSAQTSGMTLNLNAGKFSSVGMTDNIAIAYNVTIENALGGSGNDTIYANKAGDNISSNGGDDKIYSGSGNDTLNGGTGNDTVIFGDKSSDYTFSLVDAVTVAVKSLLTGLDTLTGVEIFSFTDKNLTLNEVTQLAQPSDPTPPVDPGTGTGGTGGTGGSGGTTTPPSGDLVLTGTSYSDVLTGDTGNDTLNGGRGGDLMTGGAGDDTYYVDNSRDLVLEIQGGGTDTIISSVSWTLSSETENLTLTGFAARGTGNGLDNIITGNGYSNRLEGDDGHDTLLGGGGRDTLLGGLSDDILTGGAGHDTMTGGAGADVFKFDGPPRGVDADVITDFSTAQNDVLDISDMLTGYDPLTSTLSDFVQLNRSWNNTMLKVDADGAANGHVFVSVATINNVTGLDADDMLANGMLVLANS